MMQNNIENCIKSLKQQNYPKDRYEIIIVDNNSKDNTADIIKKTRGYLSFGGQNPVLICGQEQGHPRNEGGYFRLYRF